MRHLAPKIGICLALLVAWPFVGHGSHARADCLRVQVVERLDSSQLYGDGFTLTDPSLEVAAAGPAFETADDDNPANAPDGAVLFARLRKLLVSLSHQCLAPSRGSGGTGAGSMTSESRQPVGFFSNLQIPRTELIESLLFQSTLRPPDPFISGLIDPPRFTSCS